MHQFSIVTPTFNRATYLPRVYDCLCKQGNVDLEWIIVDDGSTDNTREVVSGFEKKIEIKYIHKKNAGKPAAMNSGIQVANSHILVSLDDDDIFCPDALKTVWGYFDIRTEKFCQGCICLSGLCQYENGDIIGKKFPHDYFISDYIRYIKNKNIIGDKSEFYITNVVKRYPFPIFENEKNIAPSIIVIRIALTYKTLYLNRVLQEKQFLQGGLSTQNYWLMYPFSSELYYNEASTPPFRLKLQIKHSAKYIFFAKFNKKKHIFKKAKNKRVFPLGVLAYYLFSFRSFFNVFLTASKKNKEYKKYTSQNVSQHHK